VIDRHVKDAQDQDDVGGGPVEDEIVAEDPSPDARSRKTRRRRKSERPAGDAIAS
jgi:hypothetical protein